MGRRRGRQKDRELLVLWWKGRQWDGDITNVCFGGNRTGFCIGNYGSGRWQSAYDEIGRVWILHRGDDSNRIQWHVASSEVKHVVEIESWILSANFTCIRIIKIRKKLGRCAPLAWTLDVSVSRCTRLLILSGLRDVQNFNQSCPGYFIKLSTCTGL